MDNKQDKGFTLVELLIVIVILGILATVTVFAVRGITDQGQKSACGTDKRTLETAVEAYYAQNGTGTKPNGGTPREWRIPQGRVDQLQLGQQCLSLGNHRHRHADRERRLPRKR
jgi:prepilin-type N-terminal cleavage/methylation domain-containing protein